MTSYSKRVAMIVMVTQGQEKKATSDRCLLLNRLPMKVPQPKQMVPHFN